MGAGYKFDYPPLLAPGRHYVSLPDIHRLCVARFDYRPSREALYHGLEEFVQRFLRENIPCEMWIDGSFLTEKPDPKDVDVAVKVDYDVINTLSPSARLLVDEANQLEYLKGVESFVFTAYPRDHPLFETELNEKETWAEQYGRENSAAWLKGFVVLRLRETDVGLRIRR